MCSLPHSPNLVEKIRQGLVHTRQPVRLSAPIRYTVWLILFVLIYTFYNWVNYSYILTEDYDPFRFYRMVSEPLDQFDLLNRDVFTIMMLKGTYVESISFVALPVLLAIILARIECINQSGKFLFPLLASPALPYLVQTGKDGVYLVLLVFLVTAVTTRKLGNRENILYLVILATIVLLSKGVATLFGLITIYMIWSSHRGFMKRILLSALIGSVASMLYLELPDIDALFESSSMRQGWLSTLTVTQQIGPAYVLQSVFRSIGYFLYNFVSPVLWLFKCLERQDLSLSLEALSSILFLCRLAVLKPSRRHEILRQMALVSVLLGFSYFFLHFRYMSVLIGLVVVCEIVKYNLTVNSTGSIKRRFRLAARRALNSEPPNVTTSAP